MRLEFGPIVRMPRCVGSSMSCLIRMKIGRSGNATNAYVMRSYQESRKTVETFNIPPWTFAAIASCLAGVLALLFLDAKSFWLDEAASVEYADPHRSLAQVGLADGGHFSVYYLMLHMWLQFGTGDAHVRVLSVIPAVLAVACIFILGRQLFGTRSGAIAAFALALNPFFIAYAQEARGYSLLLLASIVSTLFFVRLVQRAGSNVDLLSYVAASVLMMYTHLFGIFVLAAQAAALPFFDGRSIQWRTMAIAALAILVLLLPLVYTAYRHGAASIDWIPQVTPKTVLGVFETLAGGLPLFLLYIALALYGVFRVFRNRGDGAVPDGAALGLVLTWLLVPVVLAIIFSELVKPIVVARYFIICLAPFALFAGSILGRVRNAALFATASFLFVTLSALGLLHYYFHTPKEDWRGAAGYILAHSQPDDVVVCDPWWTVTALRHALDRLPGGGRSPRLIGRSPLNPDRELDPRSIRARSLVATLDRHPRVWLILSEHDFAERFQHNLSAQTTMVEDALLSHKRLSIERAFFSIDVRLYSEAQKQRK